MACQKCCMYSISGMEEGLSVVKAKKACQKCCTYSIGSKRHPIWLNFASAAPFTIYSPIYGLPTLYYISQSRSQMKFSAAMYQSATQLGLLLLKNGKMCENGYPYLLPCPFKLSISIPKYLIVFECCNTNTFSLCQSDRRHLRYVYVGPTIGMANNSPEKANEQNNSFSRKNMCPLFSSSRRQRKKFNVELFN